jgi:hypothetical protein
LPIFSLYLKACPGIYLGSNLKKEKNSFYFRSRIVGFTLVRVNPCRPFLLTPYRQPVEIKEQRFNISHVSTRSTIETIWNLEEKI